MLAQRDHFDSFDPQMAKPFLQCQGFTLRATEPDILGLVAARAPYENDGSH